MNLIKKNLRLGMLAGILLLPIPSKSSFKDFFEDVSTGVITVLTIYALFHLFKKPSELEELRKKVKSHPHIPAHIKTLALEKTSSWGVNNNAYLKYVNALPWISIRPPVIDYKKAEESLNRTHYGLEKIKKQILEYLVAYQSNPTAKGKVLCLIGGPGVGKTSLVKSIATALERPFGIISTATNEWTLRGHEYTFISAEPGDFTKTLCNTHSQYPIILLDEIDKAKNNTQALLEALDPERNNSFLDSFLGFGINLSNVLFIATANNIETIPQPIRDRMELIQLEPYSIEDKIAIARNYFIPQLTQHTNLSAETIQQLSDCIPEIIRFTSRSTDGNDGVRSLRHAIDGLVNKQIFNQAIYGKTLVFTPETIKEYLDPYYTQLRLSEPKDIRTYCNNVLRKLDIPFKVFLKIERNINGLMNWVGSSTLIPIYIDFVAKFPFSQTTNPPISLNEAATQLNQSHYGLGHVKEMILDYLAGYKASNGKTTKVLCFAGAPGVGKTSFAESIAHALGRGFSKISFNPHTNLTSTPKQGSSPGEIAMALINAQASNPVILLDELEKSHPSIQTELLALLDPVQNKAIKDEYLGFEMDLSNTVFIASVNNLENLAAPLKDRMQIIEIDPYSKEERIAIANKKLIPDVATIMNTSAQGIEMLYSFVEPLVDTFMVFESGVRALKRSLMIAAEKIARLEHNKVDLSTADLKPSEVIDPYFRHNRLSDPKSPYSYCNQLFKTVSIPPEIFKKIDNKVAALTLYKAAESLIPLYAETVIKYPFGKMTEIIASLESAKTQLDKTHYGLTQVKENILDYLAGYIASNQQSTKIMCLAGAPGVGKTTVAESIATALGRKFSKISFGTITSLSSQSGNGHDEFSGPGPIAKALMDAGSLNPVILLDELDKAPQHLFAQLLEILDPAQNRAFTDRYLGFEMDLSNVMFIATANDKSMIAWPLQDRMQIITLPGYTKEERIKIAEEKLLPKISKLFNLPSQITEKIRLLINPLSELFMNLEAGVRTLNRALVIAAERYSHLTQEQSDTSVTYEEIVSSINPEYLQTKTTFEITKPRIGIVNALYATEAGNGGLLPEYASIIPFGSGKIIHSSTHGKMEKETNRRIVDYLKINYLKYGLTEEQLTKNNFSLSSSSYEPSDGNSAGIADTIALLSALKQKAIRSDYAITGAIDMLGNALAVGGYKRKLLGAAKTGIKKFILPECARPVIEAQKDVFEGLEITYISHVDEAINLLLV